MDVSQKMQGKLATIFPKWKLATDYVKLVEKSVSLKLPIQFGGQGHLHADSTKRRLFLVNVFNGSQDEWLDIVQELFATISGEQLRSAGEEASESAQSPSRSGQIPDQAIPLPSASAFTTRIEKTTVTLHSRSIARDILSDAIVHRKGTELRNSDSGKDRDSFVKSFAEVNEKLGNARDRLRVQTDEAATIETNMAALENELAKLQEELGTRSGPAEDAALSMALADVQSSITAILESVEVYLASNPASSHQDLVASLTDETAFASTLLKTQPLETLIAIKFGAESNQLNVRTIASMIKASYLLKLAADANFKLDALEFKRAVVDFEFTEFEEQLQILEKRNLVLDAKKFAGTNLCKTLATSVTIDKVTLEAYCILATFKEQAELDNFRQLASYGESRAADALAEAELVSQREQETLADLQSQANSLQKELASLEKQNSSVAKKIEKLAGECTRHSERIQELFLERCTYFSKELSLTFLAELENDLFASVIAQAGLHKSYTSCADLLEFEWYYFDLVLRQMLVLSVQNIEPELQNCPECLRFYNRCQCHATQLNLSRHLSKWHFMEFAEFLDSVENFGDWAWGLFHVPPHARAGHMKNLFSNDIVRFDLITNALRVAPITAHLNEDEDSLPEHTPTFWKALKLIKIPKGELPLDYQQKLLNDSLGDNQPSAYFRDHWIEFARMYQKDKHDQAMNSVTEQVITIMDLDD